MSEGYKCKTCGRVLKHRKSYKEHVSKAHNTRITDHTDSKEIKKLEGMTKALRKNDYDKNNATADKSKQVDLYERQVGNTTLNNY